MPGVQLVVPLGRLARQLVAGRHQVPEQVGERPVVGRGRAEHDDPGEPLEGEVEVLEPDRPAEGEQLVGLRHRRGSEPLRQPVRRPAGVEHRLGERAAVGPHVAARDRQRGGLERGHPLALGLGVGRERRRRAPEHDAEVVRVGDEERLLRADPHPERVRAVLAGEPLDEPVGQVVGRQLVDRADHGLALAEQALDDVRHAHLRGEADAFDDRRVLEVHHGSVTTAGTTSRCPRPAGSPASCPGASAPSSGQGAKTRSTSPITGSSSG